LAAAGALGAPRAGASAAPLRGRSSRRSRAGRALAFSALPATWLPTPCLQHGHVWYTLSHAAMHVRWKYCAECETREAAATDERDECARHLVVAVALDAHGLARCAVLVGELLLAHGALVFALHRRAVHDEEEGRVVVSDAPHWAPHAGGRVQLVPCAHGARACRAVTMAVQKCSVRTECLLAHAAKWRKLDQVARCAQGRSGAAGPARAARLSSKKPQVRRASPLPAWKAVSISIAEGRSKGIH
jgi:hypothetical protein